jgi:hypothetical protein
VFGFIITLAILWPPPLAERFNTPPVDEYTIKSPFIYPNEEACLQQAKEFLKYTHEGISHAKVAFDVTCFASGIGDV